MKGKNDSSEKFYLPLRPDPKYNYLGGILPTGKRDPIEEKWLKSKPKIYNINDTVFNWDLVKKDINTYNDLFLELQILLYRLVDLNTTASIKYDWMIEIRNKLDSYFEKISKQSNESLAIALKNFVNKINEIGPLSFNITDPKYSVFKKQLYYLSTIVLKYLSPFLHNSWNILVENIIWNLDKPFKY